MITPLTIVSTKQGRIFGDRADMREVGRSAQRVADAAELGAETVRQAERRSRGVLALLLLGWTERPAAEKV